ncbi:MAG: glycosyltransferase family 2 protein [Bacteroidales bacterium]|nr:glycosyltransferase family 2 protein [Bacteroidales bacterium]
MKFSVVIPLYNKAPYVAKAIQSVLSQTFSDYELIIVDDGSGDNSAEIASKALEGCGKCQLIRQENAGVSMARNNGVAASHGEYLCFLDADDWWDPHFLQEMSELIAEFPDAGIYGANYTIVNETKKKTRIAPVGVEPGFEKGYINYCQAYAKTMSMPLTSISVAISRTVFEEMGGFPKGIKLGEDFLLWIRIALKHQVAFLNKPLAFYNQDVEVANRGVKTTGYEPDSFMTFHFGQFAEEESKNKELKVLLDKIRVYSLLRFRVRNEYADAVALEIKKVDFDNVEKKYRFYYKAPYFLVWLYAQMVKVGSSIKRILR